MTHVCQPHTYVPDPVAMGDCRVCGYVRDVPWHGDNIAERLRVARDGLAKLENAWRERMAAALADQRRLVAELEAEARQGRQDHGSTQ